MTQSLEAFRKLTDTEEYLQFFEIPYDPQFVNINRLHILKQFSKSMKDIDANYPEAGSEDLLARYREALIQAYDLFLSKSPLETKLFKVFQDKPKNVVTLSQLRG